MSWSFLTQLLDEISNHSTFLGKIWLTLFMVFRIVLTVVGGESIYSDEQSTFHCNTQQPGCENICYDAFAPLSHARFWIFQIIMIATPTIMYLGFALHKIARMNDDEYGQRNRKHKINRDDDEEEAEDEEDPMMMDEILPEKEKATRHDGRRRIKRDGLMTVYVMQLLSRVVFEVGFLFGQYVLYGFKVDPVYVCEDTLCQFKLDCFVSRPTEKTIFLLIMYAVSSVCLLVTVLELLHLCIGGISDRHTRVSQQRDAVCRQVPVAPPVYHTALNKHTLAMGIKPDYDLESCRESFGDGSSTRDLDRLHKHLKRVQQHLDMVYQKSERSPSRSNSPESNATAVQQNRLNFTQKKHRSACENGLFV